MSGEEALITPFPSDGTPHETPHETREKHVTTPQKRQTSADCVSLGQPVIGRETGSLTGI